jgi:fumarylacetoacetase
MSWLEIPTKSHFSIANIPFGIISTTSDAHPRPAIAIGDYALDLSLFSKNGGFSHLSVVTADNVEVFNQPSLNNFAALGRTFHRAVRKYLQRVFEKATDLGTVLRDNEDLKNQALIPLKDVKNHLPMYIRCYTDFFAGKYHAYNCGVIFRGASNALSPNYTHLPVAYHSRASSVVVSGTSVKRPCGQILPKSGGMTPIYSPSQKMDFELEFGAFVCNSNAMGSPVTADEAEEFVMGYVLLNDLSARDVQTWESQPLGPFNAKNFGTVISPWIVMADALEPFSCEGIKHDHELVPYLQQKKKENVYNVHLEIELQSKYHL